MLRCFFLFSIFIFALYFRAQDSILRRLKQLEQPVFYSKNHQIRIDSHKVFLEIMKNVAFSAGSYDFPFHELKDISTLESADKLFKLITWNIILKDKSHGFFGFIIKNPTKNSKVTEGERVYFLKDISSQVKNPETYTGSADKWFGMLYYQMIPFDDYYILLGWDGNDGLTQKKYIDVLWFNKGSPVFGKDIFKIPRRNPRRIQFEYSADVTMSLRYFPEKKMIIYSHNSPFKQEMDFTGLYQYYGPDGSFDGFYYTKNKWKPIEDVDVRMDKSSSKKTDRPDVKKQIPLYKPK